MQSPRALSLLQLSGEKWNAYRQSRAKADAHTYHDAQTTAASVPLCRLRVVGRNEDTKRIIKAANSQGNDFIEVERRMSENLRLLEIAQEIEDAIRVPMQYWVLGSSDGVTYKNLMQPVAEHVAFESDAQVVLTILLPSECDDFVAENKQHPWLRLRAQELAGSTDPRAIATAAFHLVNASSSQHWAAYTTQRKKDCENLNESVTWSSETPSEYQIIKSGVEDAIASVGLSDMWADIIHDCVIPLSVDIQDDGDCNVREAHVLSRVYSPCNSAAVDLYLDYWYRTRYDSVEFWCNMYYRAHTNISDVLDQKVPQGNRKLNGFKRLLQMNLPDLYDSRGRWRRAEERSFDLGETKVTSLHKLLFGKGQGRTKKATSGSEVPLAARVDKLAMMELLLSSVGVSVTAARKAGDDEGNICAGNDMTWEGFQGNERWLGRNLRRACGIGPLDGDDKETDREDEGMDYDEDRYWDGDEDGNSENEEYF
ncbi:hypothetical protein DXG01_013881 [Tephrocybe rancida]|nr:hypothetical protein DXG01_013881 [Tephrocybe rancida]